MDSLASLRAELSKKRTNTFKTYGENDGRPKKRWRRKADIEEEQRQEYFAREREEQARKQAAKERKENHQSSNDKNGNELESHHPEALQKETTLVSNAETTKDETPKNEPPLAKPEVILRLRALKEPVTLFGENDWDRFNRMREIELAKEEVSKGQRNTFQSKMREMEAKDAEDDMLYYSGAKLPQSHDVQSKNKDVIDNPEEHQVPSCREDYVYFQIRKYMRLWASEIDAMSKEERRTNKGRSLAVIHEQTKDWLKPLYKMLRKKRLPRNILDALKNIFEAAAERDYLRANRMYLEQLAIGNAPWPMGATMVGIHARAARQKIEEDKIAHVMNDERTRKYIQAVKRLLTVAQRHFPTSPSKMIS